jgi:hypothetical protein
MDSHSDWVMGFYSVAWKLKGEMKMENMTAGQAAILSSIYEQPKTYPTITALPLKKEIALALAKVQGAIIPPKKDTDNPFFKSKYADLAGVWDSVRGLLAANDLAFVQLPTTDGAKVSVTGQLLHKSGECIESTITGSAKDQSPQAIGSCITYLRRYQMSAMLGIAAEDDDGAAASGTTKPEKGRTVAQEKGPFSHGIPKEQHDREQAEAEQRAGETAKSQIDLGSFEDKIKNVKESSKGKTGAGVPWTLYAIETEGHGTLNTFSSTVFEDAAAACKAGALVMVHAEPTPKGPKIVGVEFLQGEAHKALTKASKAA